MPLTSSTATSRQDAAPGDGRTRRDPTGAIPCAHPDAAARPRRPIAEPHACQARARLDGVRLSYDDGATWALDGISLAVAPGERLCVLGPNGSGKSTLAQLLAGLEAPDVGTVELAGRVVFDGQAPDAAAYRAARHRTGLVFQNPEDQIVTSVVADDVAFGPENLGLPHDEIVRRVDEELERVAMTAYAQADPARLSGGQQQRVALASALAMHPDMLVLDEPGAMLDVRGRRGIMHVLEGLQASGTTIVHITHFMDEALAADRVIVLAAGRVALEGTPREVFSHAGKLRELGLDVPLVTRTSLDLGLGACCSAEELAGALRPHGPAATAGTGSASQACVGALAGEGPGAQAGTTPALAVRDVSFSYGRTPALCGVSLSIQAGELVALTGQTGSGKSTLARLVCALAAPDRGTIEVAGIPTANRRRRRELRGRVGYVMQHPERQLFAKTVFGDVAYGPRNLGLPAAEVDRRVRTQLGHLGLADRAEDSPFGLSGGQQRLVALAGVLSMEPDVLVLDEPVAGLDPRGAERLRAIIQELHERGTTILMVSHSMEDVARLATRMVVLDAGHVRLDGTPAELFAQETLLHELGLGIPAPLGLAHELGALGVAVAGAPLTAEALVAGISLARRRSLEPDEAPAGDPGGHASPLPDQPATRPGKEVVTC